MACGWTNESVSRASHISRYHTVPVHVPQEKADELVKTVPICCHCHHIITYYSEERDFECAKQLIGKYGREKVVIEVNEVDVPHVGVSQQNQTTRSTDCMINTYCKQNN